MSFSHRPGSLRQENKKHKTKRSKRAIRLAQGAGRVASDIRGPKVGVKRASEAGKQIRANYSNQIRKKKREDARLRKRVGSDAGPPKLCVWVSLSAKADPQYIQKGMLSTATRCGEASTDVGMVTATFSQFKQRLTFLTPERDLLSLMEFTRVADLLLVVLPVEHGEAAAIDEEGEAIITALKAAGLPAVVGVVQGLEHLKGKRQADMRKWGQRFFETEFAGEARAIDASNSSLLTRTLSTTPTRRVHWRSIRSYLVADTVKLVPSGGHSASELGALHVRGYVRGRPFGVNQLIHLTEGGHFKLRQINSSAEPFPLKPNHHSSGATDVKPPLRNSEGVVLAVADPGEQEDLAQEAVVDGLAGEQTWPTQEELAQAAVNGMEGVGEAGTVLDQDALEEVGEPPLRAGKGRPQGWSDYQAAWLSESGSVDGEGSDDLDGRESWAFNNEAENQEGLGSPTDATLEAANRKIAEDEDTKFPDEVDTPFDRPARERFARYRALKSFRTSPWDPKESLPSDYARIFQFDDFAAVQKNVLSAGEAIERRHDRQLIDAMAPPSNGPRDSRLSSFASYVGETTSTHCDMNVDEDRDSSETAETFSRLDQSNYVPAGQYVEVVVEDVPVDLLSKRKKLLGGKDCPLVLFSLLRHEHRLTSMHLNISREARFVEPIASKEPLMFYCGFRRWTGKPVFSQVNLNCDKHKYERFLRPDRFTAATVYGPTTYQPCPVLVFKEIPSDGASKPRTVLVASGTLLGIDPDRIVLKKIVLTGYPIRVRKRRAVVKHMFHRPEDVKWYKPAELVTKYGLTGHIKESVGTHGLMKVIFNKAIKQNDTVCLNLYKRVYPKMVDGKVAVR